MNQNEELKNQYGLIIDNSKVIFLHYHDIVDEEIEFTKEEKIFRLDVALPIHRHDEFIDVKRCKLLICNLMYGNVAGEDIHYFHQMDIGECEFAREFHGETHDNNIVLRIILTHRR